MKQKICFIINPVSGFNKTQKNLKEIKKIIKEDGDHKIFLTHHSMHATTLTKKALYDGVNRIVVVGGDGTLNEVVNGFFEKDQVPINEKSSVAHVALGTGSDFIRNFKPQGSLESALKNAMHADAKLTDLGLVFAQNSQGEPISRYFVNASSLGLSGLVVGFMRHMTRKFGGKAAYFMAVTKALNQFRAPSLRIKNEYQEMLVENCSLATLTNGQYFAGGMRIAPYAKVDDGLLEQIVIRDLDVWFFLTQGFRVYFGTHLELANVSHMKVADCYISSMSYEPVFIETDGELMGQLPAHFKILPKKILIVR